MGYSRGQVLLHWTIAALVVLEWATAGSLKPALAVWQADPSVEGLASHPFAVLHVLGGAILFALVLSLLRTRPGGVVLPRSAGDPPVLITLEWLTRVGLYLTLLAMPLAGLAGMAWGGAAGRLHARLGVLLAVLVGLHLGAVAWRTLALRDGSILRVLRWPKPRIPQI